MPNSPDCEFDSALLTLSDAPTGADPAIGNLTDPEYGNPGHLVVYTGEVTGLTADGSYSLQLKADMVNNNAGRRNLPSAVFTVTKVRAPGWMTGIPPMGSFN